MFWVFGISTCQTRRIVVFIVVVALVAVVVGSADDHIKLEIGEAATRLATKPYPVYAQKN